MIINELFLEFHAIETRIKNGKITVEDRPYQEFALRMFEQVDCKKLSIDNAIKAVELLNTLDKKLNDEYKELGDSEWMSITTKYKTLHEKELLIFVLYPAGITKKIVDPKICVVEIP